MSKEPVLDNPGSSRESRGSKLNAHLALFFAQVLYAASFPVAKEVMDTIPSIALVLFRVSGAIILFWLSSLFIKERTDKKDIPRFILLGLFGVAINQTLFLKGLHLTSPIDAAIMMITSPILVLIIASIILKERITFTRSAGIAIGFGGAAYLVYQNLGNSDKEASFLGDLYVFINAVSWGTYLVLVKPLMKKYHTITVLKWTFLFGFPMVLPFGAGEFLATDWTSVSQTNIMIMQHPVSIWWGVAFVVVFTTFVAYLLNTLALNTLSSTIASAYIYLQPLLTALISIYFFGHETLTYEKIVSALLIFIGVYLVSIPVKKNP
ncbi:MAG TPA: DMT family transporter [Bacteroidia bacterium]|jgi:drug/metabolite transporter (DMT)-like permease